MHGQNADKSSQFVQNLNLDAVFSSHNSQPLLNICGNIKFRFNLEFWKLTGFHLYRLLILCSDSNLLQKSYSIVLLKNLPLLYNPLITEKTCKSIHFCNLILHHTSRRRGSNFFVFENTCRIILYFIENL